MVLRRRLDLTGPALVFITTTIKDWKPVFESEVCVSVAVQTLRKSIEIERLSLFGYVFMPSHVHFLIGFPEIQRMSTVVGDFKRLTSRRIKPLLSPIEMAQFEGASGFALWMPRFDDVLIYSEEQFRVKLNYIHENPVRATLVTSPERYRYSSATDWLGGETGILPIDKDFSFLIDC